MRSHALLYSCLLLAVTLPGSGLQAPLASVPPAGPQLTFATSRYDFGPIPAGAVISHTFEFRNTGSKPLVIATIGTSCGCTTPEWTRTPVAPGQSGRVSVRFSTAGRAGRQNKVLTVESNAGSPVVLAIAGQVDGKVRR